MHELAIINDMIALAETELSRIGAVDKVNTITIRVGCLSGASPEALRFAFDVVVLSTRFCGARLVILQPRITCRCRTCGRAHEAMELLFQCPSCGGCEVEIEGGRDLCLESIEVQELSRVDQWKSL